MLTNLGNDDLLVIAVAVVVLRDGGRRLLRSGSFLVTQQQRRDLVLVIRTGSFDRFRDFRRLDPTGRVAPSDFLILVAGRRRDGRLGDPDRNFSSGLGRRRFLVAKLDVDFLRKDYETELL